MGCFVLSVYVLLVASLSFWGVQKMAAHLRRRDLIVKSLDASVETPSRMLRLSEEDVAKSLEELIDGS